MRYIVAGSTGFIGAHLCCMFVHQGHRVIALGRNQHRLDARFSDVPGIDTQTYLHGPAGAIDLGTTLAEAARRGPIHGAVNLAGLAHVRVAATEAYRPDVAFARDLVLACSTTGVPALVNISSIAARDPASARTPALRAYGQAKQDAERSIDSLASPSGVAAITLRPPAVWGPGAPGSFATVAKLLARGLPLPIRSLETRRAYLHVDSLCQRIMHLLTVLGRGSVPPGHLVFEVADPPLSLSEIFAAVASEMNVPLRTVPFPAPLLTLGLRAIGKGDFAELASTELILDTAPLEHFLATGVVLPPA